jgi:rfaE bifunctional protein nucleotidyltransferase chain/domain
LLRKDNCFSQITFVTDQERVLSFGELAAWREGLRKTAKKLVVTNGCFDLLHVGHVTYLQTARNLGDALLIGVNGDASVRALKGAGRPLNAERDRALVLAALRCVDAVCVFSDVRAVRFLEAAQPDIYVKGGDYTLDTLEQDERRAVETRGGRIEIIPFVPGKSTTGLLKRMGGIC